MVFVHLSQFCLDFDDLGSAPSTPHYAIDGKTPISNLNFSDLQRQIQELTLQVHISKYLTIS